MTPTSRSRSRCRGQWSYCRLTARPTFAVASSVQLWRPRRLTSYWTPPASAAQFAPDTPALPDVTQDSMLAGVGNATFGRCCAVFSGWFQSARPHCATPNGPIHFVLVGDLPCQHPVIARLRFVGVDDGGRAHFKVALACASCSDSAAFCASTRRTLSWQGECRNRPVPDGWQHPFPPP